MNASPFFYFKKRKSVLYGIYHSVNVTTWYKEKKNYAVLRFCGNSSTVCASIVTLACSSISALCSRKYWAVIAIASSTTASCHEALAAFKCLALRSRLAISKSCKVRSENWNSFSGFGMSFMGGARA